MWIRELAAVAVVLCGLSVFGSRRWGTPRALPPSAVVTMDWLRGLAAVAVLFGHVRGLFMQDFDALRSPSAAWKLFYLASGFGHQAVIVFFVLSGFLVGASALSRQFDGTWSFVDYLTRRLARLYVVLVPGLLLTAAWDLTGMSLFGTEGLYGGVIAARHLDLPNVTHTLSWGHFVGNLVFLQHLFIQPFGSNNPLWSLPYELWAYLLFPILLLVGDRSLSSARRASYLLLVTAALIAGGWKLSLYFGVWMIGAIVALWWRRSRFTEHASNLRYLASWAAFGAALVLARSGKLHDTVADLLLGACTATALAATLLRAAGRPTVTPTTSTRAATTLASFSYTLYVAHYPVLTFLFAGWMPEGRWAASSGSVARVLCITLLLTLYAFGLARLTESHTERVRVKLRGLMRTPTRTA